LAVISCALALLAAQPAIGGTSAVARERTPAMRASTGIMPVEAIQPAAVSSSKRSKGERAQAQAKATTIRRLHVLATVEILQRLLAFELRPVDSHVMPALLLEPVCVLILDTPMSPPHRGWVPEGAGISVEGDFARARLGLAPPLA
jgi:hypothetical protein